MSKVIEISVPTAIPMKPDGFIMTEHWNNSLTFTQQKDANSPLLRKRRSCEMVHTPSPCVRKALFQLDKLKDILLHRINEDAEIVTSETVVQGKQTKNWKHLRFLSPNSSDSSEFSDISLSTELSVKGVGGLIGKDENIVKKKHQLSSEEILKQVEVLIRRLEDDRNETIAMLDKERRVVEDLGKRIDEMNIRRMQKLPEAVQKEHDACARDISELYWHVNYTERQLQRTRDRLEVAQELNKHLKEDIDFVKEHCPLVEEKLSMEKEAMNKIRELQKQTDAELKEAKMELDCAEKKYKSVVEVADAERELTRHKLEGVRNKLKVLAKEYQHSQAMHQAYINKAENSREKLKLQEKELEELKLKSARARQAEEDESNKIDDLNNQLKQVEFETGDVLRVKQQTIKNTENLHEEMRAKVAMCEANHEQQLRKLRSFQEKNRDLKLDIEDMRDEVKACEKSVAKSEKELERYNKERIRCDKLLKETSEELQSITSINIELKAQLEKEENKAQAMEVALKATADNLRKHVQDEMRHRAKFEAKKQQTMTDMMKGKSESKKKKNKVTKKLTETEKLVTRIQAEVDELQNEYEAQNKIIADKESKLSGIKSEHVKVETNLTEEKNVLLPQQRKLLEEQVGLNEKIKEMQFEEEQMNQKMKDMILSKNSMNKRIAATEINIDKLKIELEELNMQIDANKGLNDNLKDQLDKANARLADRQFIHEQMLGQRLRVKENLETTISDELKLNGELAKSYKTLQNDHINIKDKLMGIYDSKVKIETSIKDHKQLVGLQKKLNEALEHYYQDRGKYNMAGLDKFNNESEVNSKMMTKVQWGLEKALTNISVFLKSQIDGGASDEVHNAAMRSLAT